MGTRKNRRTLKKRIRRIITLCILITVLLFSGIIVYFTAMVSKFEAQLFTAYYSYSIGHTMNSEYFLRQMGIKGLEEFNPEDPKVKEWIDTLMQEETQGPTDNPLVKDGGDLKPGLRLSESGSININTNKPMDPEGLFFLFETQSMAQIKIILNDKTVYKSSNWGQLSPIFNINTSEDGHNDKLVVRMLNYFSTESGYDLTDSKGNVIGNVKARINADFIFAIFLGLVIFIAAAALLCLLVAYIISRFITISITNPVNQLEEKIKSIASGDYKSTLNAQIVLKKPLRELESLAHSTNIIMYKMKEYSDRLESQKIILENQNEELEAQNEELIESKRQIEEAQALMVQSQNMASIGQLTAAITHEINTPLGAINSNVQMFNMLMRMLEGNETVKADGELKEFICQMKEANNINIMACERVTQIIKSLKSFTKLDQAEFQEADINEGLRSVLILTSNLWKRKIAIHEEYGSVSAARCFPGLLNQVFMNIIVNAIQSIVDTGDVYIKTYSDGKYVYASIRDTGCGIRKDHLPRIFEMGFSTKETGIGAGMGLSICNNIIKKHNGEIRVSSEEGKGTEFIVCIPINTGNTGENAADQAVEETAGTVE